jgi:hypothetical protein
MKPCLPSPSCRCLLAGCLFLVAASAVAQPRYVEQEPRWLSFSLPEASVGMEVESLKEDVRLGSASSTHEQLFLAPLVGLRTSGSIYHPNLISFDFNGEGGWGWLTDSVKSTGSSFSRDESSDLLRYVAQVSLLSGKPYNAIFSASQDHTFRNYDSFSSYTVDTVRYSGRVGWNTATLTLNADAGYRDEKSTGINGFAEIAETYLNFSGIQKRQSGQSALTYRYDEFDSIVNAGVPRNSLNHAVGISDSEAFGSRRQVTATTGASFSEYQYSGQQTETFTASENITANLRPKLDSYLAVNFSHSRMDPAAASSLQGMGGVRHRLYESLTSTLEAHGSYDDSSSAFSSGSNDRYGLGLHEDYTKRLGDWGRLSLGAAIIADHEDHASSGGVQTVFDEPHNLTNAPVFLKNPRVITSTIQVRAASDNFPYGSDDFTIIPAGELTEIRLVLNSLNIALHGSAVLVNYQSRSFYNASFESFNGSAQVRLDLLGKFGVYGRVNWLDNNAPPAALTQTLTDLVGGADFAWRWFRTGAEYEDYQSNFSQYDAWRFFQSFTYQSSRNSTLNVNFTQNFYRYPGTGSQDRYQFITRYNTQLPFSLAWYIEGGYSLQEVSGTEQNFAFGRTGFTWSRGKLSFRTGYEYNYQTTTTGLSKEQRDRNYVFAYLKRSF